MMGDALAYFVQITLELDLQQPLLCSYLFTHGFYHPLSTLHIFIFYLKPYFCEKPPSLKSPINKKKKTFWKTRISTESLIKIIIIMIMLAKRRTMLNIIITKTIKRKGMLFVARCSCRGVWQWEIVTGKCGMQSSNPNQSMSCERAITKVLFIDVNLESIIAKWVLHSSDWCVNTMSGTLMVDHS